MELVSLLPLVGIALLFWLLIIRPASRRQKLLGQMQSSLAVGDEVMLTSGFYATVLALQDDRVELSLAPGVDVTVARGAIGSVVPVAVETKDGLAQDPVDPDELDAPHDQPEGR